MAALGLGFCAWAFPSCGKLGPLFVALRWLLIAVVSLVLGTDSRAEAQQLCRMSFVAHGTWNLPGPGVEPMSPTLVEANFLPLDLQGYPRAHFVK